MSIRGSSPKKRPHWSRGSSYEVKTRKGPVIPVVESRRRIAPRRFELCFRFSGSYRLGYVTRVSSGWWIHGVAGRGEVRVYPSLRQAFSVLASWFRIILSGGEEWPPCFQERWVPFALDWVELQVDGLHCGSVLRFSADSPYSATTVDLLNSSTSIAKSFTGLEGAKAWVLGVVRGEIPRPYDGTPYGSIERI